MHELAPRSPACQAVATLAGRGVVKGHSDGTFGPDRPVTRAELAKMLVMALGLPPEPGPIPFADAGGHWAATQGYLQAAIKLKAVSGYPDGTFRPNDPISRAQIVKVLAASAGLAPSTDPPYGDIAKTDWYSGWVAAASSAGLIGPNARTPIWTTGSFAGNTPATRAETAILLTNLPAFH